MASQKVFGSYQEIIDLHTEANHVSAIGIHTPTGDTPRKMFKGYFDQYKKYKYLGASVTLVPAARLPADPMGVRYSSSGQVLNTHLDPRDALNPIMFHGCHGDDMGAILNTLYGNDSSISDSVDGLDGGATSITDFVGASLWINMERLYYKALTDKTWKKANPMAGFKKGNLRPLVYSLATNRQIMPYEGSPDNLGALTEGGDPTTNFVEDDDGLIAPERQNNLQFFTPRLTRLGWMETRNVHAIAKPGIEGIDSADDIPEAIAQMLDTTTTPAEMPKIYMGIILMAPAYGTEQYYRMIVNHRFAFKEFRGISFMPTTDGVPAYTNAELDLFNGTQYEDWEAADSPGGSGGGSTPRNVVVDFTFPSAAINALSEAGRSIECALQCALTEGSSSPQALLPFTIKVDAEFDDPDWVDGFGTQPISAASAISRAFYLSEGLSLNIFTISSNAPITWSPSVINIDDDTTRVNFTAVVSN